MRDRVVHRPTGIELDLAVPGYGHLQGAQIVAECLGKGRREDPVLVCGRHGQPVYLIRRIVPGNHDARALWANHFGDGSQCSSGMSDEHKRQTEYIARAADDAGHRTVIETPLPGTTIKPDATVHGTVTVAVEVQRSGLARHHAVARTGKAAKVGATSLWFNDRDPLDPPPWFFHVPSVGMNKLPWDVIPHRRSATATSGLRKITAKQCRFPTFDRCPTLGRGHCGGFHPGHEAVLGLTVDDVAAMVPAGLLVPLRFPRSKGVDVLIVSPESRELFRELTQPGAAPATQPTPLVAPSTAIPDLLGEEPRRVECTNLLDESPGVAVMLPPAVGTFLDWSHPRHWLRTAAPCHWCRRSTQLCDYDGVPMHKVCAEHALSRAPR